MAGLRARHCGFWRRVGFSAVANPLPSLGVRPDQLDDDHGLMTVLADAQTAGFLGRAPLIDHVDNGLGFATALEALDVTTCADLGSGGGVPALVVARALPGLSITCIDRGTKRCEFLLDAVTRLDLESRVEVIEGDVEDVARLSAHDGAYEAVTARSFGPPAVTAEAAARLLVHGGTLVVSEPPSEEAGRRWEHAGLDVLGLRFDGLVETDGLTLALVRRTNAALDLRYPRRAATVRKRPLF